MMVVITKMKYKIEFYKEKCMGCGACTICENWELDEEGKAKPKQLELEELGCNQEVAESCPAKAIKIVNIK